ncbi:RNA 2'-phosphotransferase [Aneurinibacillus aneurinilyticus]|uniref:RNA 2'-phosphotransferase n=1 Tax=Aneurinibacillus aneurinilyticus TaxID=1391 RepID=UPI002E1FDBBB|nr:RNA 2'-phosphotransferase [Aneurinibacillus aneurinilyticus]
MDYTRLSKELSYALRHAPWEYELELDEEGWVNSEQLLQAFRETSYWRELNEQHLRKAIETSNKKRHEIKGGKIRALYGHSIPHKISKQAEKPPEILYHGTPRSSLASIMAGGLLPRGRQYVHLSVDTSMALQVGKRRDSQPVILQIRAREASLNGIVFYKGNEQVWLADHIPQQYIRT